MESSTVLEIPQAAEPPVNRRQQASFRLRRWQLQQSAVRLLTLAGLLLLALISVKIRTRAITSPFWGDEGLSIGIAAHPLGQIPTVLHQDGSPPLYYMLLHFWMGLFGSSEVATHALSMVFA